MKIKNICFCYKHNQDFEFKKEEGQNLFRLLFFRKKTEHIDTVLETENQATTMILIDQREFRGFRTDGTPYVAEWIDFELESGEKKKLMNSGFPVDSEVVVQEFQSMIDILQMMHREFYSDEPQHRDILSAYFQLFFTKLYDRVTEKKSIEKQPQYEKLLAIRAEIYANPTKRMSVKELASEAYLSLSYFQHLYKEYFNTTVVSDMISSRIERGKHLLVSTNDTVKEISKELNYGDEVSFARQFRKVVGISPKKYKEQFGKQ